MSKIPTELTNLKMKAEILHRVFGDDPKIYQHNFPLKGYKCLKCSVNFWDWAFINENGDVGVGEKLCSVIGLEEVSMFHDPFSEVIRGDDGGY